MIKGSIIHAGCGAVHGFRPSRDARSIYSADKEALWNSFKNSKYLSTNIGNVRLCGAGFGEHALKTRVKIVKIQ